MVHHKRLVLPLILWALALATLATVEPGEEAQPAPDDGQPIARQSSFRWPAEPEAEPAANAESPLQLTASDGTGLRLVELTARGVLEPPLAFTELSMAFENPEDRLREGRFRITLPPGAAISRFAMKIGDHWQEGEVVERQRARQVYEDFLHRRQDPALLEHEAGNEFSARVFPIPPRAVKELIVSYSHELPGSADAYVIPLLGLPRIDRLDLQVQLAESKMPAGRRRSRQEASRQEVSNLGGSVRERRVVSLAKDGWTPNADFEIRQSEVAERQGLRHDNLTLVRVAAPVESELEEIESLYVLVDSSASRALGFERQIALLRELLAGLRDGAGSKTPVAVAAFDQAVHPIFTGTAGDLDGATWDRLRALGALGPSDPHRALRWLGERLAEDRPDAYRRVLVVSDGVATAGEVEGQDLRRAVRELERHGVRRLDVLATGGRRDDELLRHLVTGNLEDDGQVIDASAVRNDIARRLTRASRSGIEVVVPGATWVWPRTLDAVQAGDEVLIYADLPASRPLRVELGGTAAGVAAAAVFDAEPKLLERAWIKARIDRLSRLRETDFADDADLRRALQREATGLSIEHRVLCPFTAFLVLETENDYRRYGLDRRARADILTVGAAGIEVLARSQLRPSPATRTEPPKPDAAADFDAEFGAAPEGPIRAATEEIEPALEDLGYVEGNAHIAVDEDRRRQLDELQSELEEELSQLEAGSAPPAPLPPPEEPEALRVEEGYDEVTEEIVVESRRQPRARRVPIPDPTPDDLEIEPPPAPREPETPALSGRFAEIIELLNSGKPRQALERASAWHAESPGDVLALVALGEAFEAGGDLVRAARAYGSLIDLFPSRADLRRYAGERLERLDDGAALELAVDTYQKAVDQRPDHPSSHRLLAYALLRSERPEAAFEALAAAVEQKYPGNRFRGVERILREDLGLAAAAWTRAEPERAGEIRERLRHAGGTVEDGPSLRFVLTWETDANDVDLHVYDGKGGHAYYSDKTLASGGELYADVTTGYGPECFTIRGSERRRAYPYRLQAHYYSRGPMGYGMGMLRIVEHDGDGGLRFDQRPFVVMNDRAYIELGKVGKAR